MMIIIALLIITNFAWITLVLYILNKFETGVRR